MVIKVLKVVCGCWIVLALIGGLLQIYTAIDNDLKKNREDMKCVHKLVSQGIDRIDIKQVDGVCYVNTNAYYSTIK